MAERPLDLEIVEKRREDVMKVGGEGLMIEASTIIGAFALMTCVVDSTGRKEIEDVVKKTMKKFSSFK